MEVLLLGNGFDLYHDLPTKYINFINTVNFLKNNFDEAKTTTIGKVFNNEELYGIDEGIKNFYERYYTVASNFPLDVECIKRLHEASKNNIWFTYLSKISEKIDTWIDFEKEIGNVVNTFEHFFDQNSGENINFKSLSEAEYGIISFFDFFYYEVNDGLVVNGGIKRYAINKEFLSYYTLSSRPSINKKKIIDHIYEQLVELSDMLKSYLICFVENVVDKIAENNLVTLQNLFLNAGHVFTLNYTNTFEKLYLGNGKKKIYHIHGNVEGDIVLGLNSNKFDELDNLNTDFLCFKKFYQRVYYKTDLDYLSAIKFTGVFDKRFETNLSVVGHSLDITDQEIITTLFDNATKITIYCHDRKAIGDYIKNLVSIYGKSDFDKLRISKNLSFVLLDEIN